MTRPTTPSGEITGRPSFTPSRVPRLIRIVRKGEEPSLPTTRAAIVG